MERITLREAAERTSRSITTLRRYIRSGRLRAEKRHGRFGPEYFVTLQDLAEAGLEAETTALATRPTPRDDLARSGAGRIDYDAVPLALYQDLQMKHEQLLVQYGMVRAGGLRAIELQAELDSKRRQLESVKLDLEERLQRETARLRKQLRESRLELKGRALQISAQREKIKALEMLSRNSVTTETIERQFFRVMDQSRRVDRLTGGADPHLERRERKRDH